MHAIDDTLQQNNLSFQEHLLQLRLQHDDITGQLTNMQSDFNLLTETMNGQSTGYNQHHIQVIQQQNKIANIIRDHTYKTGLQETLNKTSLQILKK